MPLEREPPASLQQAQIAESVKYTPFGLEGGVGEQKVPALTLNVNIFFNIEAMPPNLATFPKLYLAKIWYDLSWSK